jgi:anti-sigma B factor antagonist
VSTVLDVDRDDMVEGASSFGVIATRNGEVSALVVVGEVDSGSAAELTAAFDAELVAGARTIRLDLSDTSFVDSSGLVVLLDLRAAVASHSAHLTLVHPSRAVRRVLEVSELSSVFDVEP